MKTIEEELKELIIAKAGSVNKFAQEIGVAQSTLVSVFSRGINKANINTIIKICKALNISADELVEGRIVNNHPVDYVLTESDAILIEKFSRLDAEDRDHLLSIIDHLLKKGAES